MNKDKTAQSQDPHVVIIGGGFGGLYTAKALRKAPVRVTIIDKRNFHLFQPLLYQVATGGLSPADIAAPLRAVLKDAQNITALTAEVVDIDPQQKEVILRDGKISYDVLIVAAGAGYDYFGNPHWAELAPSLKTIEDAIEIRRRILLAFETAEREPDPQKREALLTFVIVGGGPTGVELAGALGELAHTTLDGEFRNIDPTQARIIIIEAQDRILTTYTKKLSTAAEKSLRELNVEIQKETFLLEIDEQGVKAKDTNTDQEKFIPARTVLWAAGVKASPLSEALAGIPGVELDKLNRVKVQSDLSLPGCPNIFVIGDQAHFKDEKGEPLPGVAQVAMQQGDYIAERLMARRNGDKSEPFVYNDKGNLAVIGRNAAVADLGFAQFSGFPAWLIWIFIHIRFLIEFDNKILVLIQWAWNYFTRHRGARLVTGDEPFPIVDSMDQGGIDELFSRPLKESSQKVET